MSALATYQNIFKIVWISCMYFFIMRKKKYIYIHVHVTSGACVKKIPNLSQCEYFKYTCSVYNYTEFARLINNMRVRRSWYTGHHYCPWAHQEWSRRTDWSPRHSTKCLSRDSYRNWSSLELKIIPSVGSPVSYILSDTTGYHTCRRQTANNRRRRHVFSGVLQGTLLGPFLYS